MTTVPLQPFQITDPRWPKLPQSTRMLEEVLRILGGRTNQAGQELDRWRRQFREKRIAAATPLNQGPAEGSAEKRWREREGHRSCRKERCRVRHWRSFGPGRDKQRKSLVEAVSCAGGRGLQKVDRLAAGEGGFGKRGAVAEASRSFVESSA